MVKELLLEIGTEEIPAAFLPGAMAHLQTLCEKFCAEERLSFNAVRCYATPRRLILHVEGLADRQEDLSRKVIGPPKSAGYDKEGNPTKAATGFARSQGVEVSDLIIEETPRGDYLAVIREETGRETPELLSDGLPKIITSIHFPKSMRWGSGTLRFVRPIHWVLAIYDDAVIPFEIDGIRSGNLSRGHRFMSPGSFTVHSYKSYKASARERFVMYDLQERVDVIHRQISAIEKEVKGRVIPDEALLQEVACLVEFPTVLCGGFDTDFLAIPRQVLITSMREHQRYFSMENKKGDLIPYFITVSNTRPKDTSTIVAGNERVLRARLTDAAYFFETDRKHSLSDFTASLQGVTFQEKLGTLAEKVERIRKLAQGLAEKIGLIDPDALDRVVSLCKADLCTEMVGEFPSLQGVMGREYALLSGESDAVASAIEEHYRPRFVGDLLPESDLGAVVSLADKMDTIAGCFAVGLKPSGSVDPYALRRQTLAILGILQKKGYPVGLGEMTEVALQALQGKVDVDTGACRDEILGYFRGRLSAMLTGEEHRYDTVDAVLGAGFDRVRETRARVEALSRFREEPLFEPFTVVCKRAMNIIKDHHGSDVDPALFKETCERDLFEAAAKVEDELPALLDTGQYGGALNAIAALRDPIDQFFEGVLVMDKEKAIRNNRLALLTRIASLISPIADFSRIVIE
ncbi:MAG: glycine--tRNA ligase subunit beta [Deltaproteobacteria bacterium]|nr:glycine--tRNA ligase subunit beta [Deltaproteobacteria bacterium]